MAIIIRGTTIGTITDFDGNFSIENNSSQAILDFSFVGMKPITVSYSGQEQINVVMQSSHEQIDEVIVVAYGVQSKATLTGSIQSVDAEKLRNVTSPFISNIIQSEASGLLVANSSGAPGEKPQLRIRGEGSINFTNEPLWVVDGVIYGTSSPNVNPNDIESISILKDAAASALFGSRASNGVIMIQTKTGQRGKSNFKFTSSTGISQLNRTI